MSKLEKEKEKEYQVEDFLSVDPPIPGQNFACISFVSPEKELANKDQFILHQFLKSKCKDFGFSEQEIIEQYKDFLYDNQEDLEKQFYEREDFQTTIRGIKVRGIYDTYREAQVRAKLLQTKDRNFHVFVGQVGYWLPWDPNADKITDQEYSESQLNKLVKKYQENTKKRDTFFEQQKDDSLKKIKEDNERNVDSNPSVSTDQPITSLENDEKDQNIKSTQQALDEVDPWMKRKMDDNLETDTNNQPDNSDIFDLDK